MADSQLFLIDAMALIYRAHFALSKAKGLHKQGPSQINTGAILGFANSLVEVWQKVKPDYIIVAMDGPGPTFRTEAYSAYKAHRESQPEDITQALPYIKRLLEGFHIPLLRQDHYEADDIIGTLARQGAQKGMQVYMMTTDKDFSQLVGPNIFWYKPGMTSKPTTIWGVKEVCEKWNFQSPTQVIDLLGLWGDSIDNIPGVPGIGEKRAQALIQKFGSIENLYTHITQLSSKQQEKLRMYQVQALLSKKLATIVTDIPLYFNWKKLSKPQLDADKLLPLLQELGFRKLRERLFPSIPSSITRPQNSLPLFENSGLSVKPTQDLQIAAKAKNKNYTCISSISALGKLSKKLAKQKRFCFDTETEGLHAHGHQLLGISISFKADQAFYLPLPSNKNDQIQYKKILQAIFANPRIEKIGHNLKYDCAVLRTCGIEIVGPFFDTMVAHHLLTPEARHSLDSLAMHYFNHNMIPITELIGEKGKAQRTMLSVPLQDLTVYACEDADITLQLYERFKVELQEEKLATLFETIEMPLIPVLVELEQNGVAIHLPSLAELQARFDQELAQLTKQIYQYAQQEFNINSPKQLGEILFDKLQITTQAAKTKSGQYATSEGILSKLQRAHPIIEHILSYRALKKLVSTYVEALPRYLSPIDQRIHTSYNQTVVSSGRLSSSQPNLQNIPIRTPQGKSIRKAFVPKDKQHVLLSADYSQIELRIMAHFSCDETLSKAFQEGKDIHTATAAKIFHCTIEEVTDSQRRQAKTVNFGIIYGISAYGLSQNLNIHKQEAQKIIDAYFTEFPKVKSYIHRSLATAREKGYCQTLLGRKQKLPDLQSGNSVMRNMAERLAINMPIQGSGAELMKKAMIEVYSWLQREKLASKLILQVHDELVLEVEKNELDKITKGIKSIMEQVYPPLHVPLVVDVGTGDNWFEAH